MPLARGIISVEKYFGPKLSKIFWQIIWVYKPNRSLSYLVNSLYLDKIDLAFSLPCKVEIMPLGKIENKSRTSVLALFSIFPRSIISTFMASQSLNQFLKYIGLGQQSCPRPIYFQISLFNQIETPVCNNIKRCVRPSGVTQNVLFLLSKKSLKTVICAS